MAEGRLRNKDYWAFEKARQEALKSDFKNVKIGAVLVAKDGHIISQGHNQKRTDPYQMKMNKYRKFRKNPEGKAPQHYKHSEIDCLKNIPYNVKKDIDWKSVSLYVYRVCEAKPLKYGMSRPCPACLAAIKQQSGGKLRNIYFTGDYGYCYEHIEG